MKWLAVLLVMAIGSVASAQTQTLVRSCPTKPDLEGFNACPNSTWELAANAKYLVVLRREVTTQPWLLRTELIEGDRVYACTAPNIQPGAAFGSGCMDAAGARVTLPGRTDNWLAASELGTSPLPPTSGLKVIPLKWSAPTLDLKDEPLTDATKPVSYLLHIRDDFCTVPEGQTPPPLCGYEQWTTLDVGNVLTYSLATDVRKCLRLQSVGPEGPAGITEYEICATPRSSNGPAAPIGFSVVP